jgi:hypothetical protein
MTGPHAESTTTRRIKHAVISTFLGACTLVVLFYLTLAVVKMSKCDPLGYQQRDHRTGEIRK